MVRMRDPAPSRNRLERLAEDFRDKRYRDSYVATHTRGVLAQQMRNFRGDQSQVDFGEEIGKRQTVVSRLENPAYGGWSLRTMLEVARKKNVAVFCRFVDFPTFFKLTEDLSEIAMCPASYDQEVIDQFVIQENAKQLPREVLDAYYNLVKQQRDQFLEYSEKPREKEWNTISVSNPGQRIVIETREAPPSINTAANDAATYTVSDAAG